MIAKSDVHRREADMLRIEGILHNRIPLPVNRGNSAGRNSLAGSFIIPLHFNFLDPT
jgi:hypothetical protein